MSAVESDVNVFRVSAAIRGMFIRQPQVLEIFSALDGLRHAGSHGGEVACLMITGVPGVGKSTLLTRFEATHPRSDVADRTVVPVLYVRVPPRATVKGLAKAMLLRLGSEFAHRGDEIDLTHQVLTLLRECRVELLVLDEANHLIDRGAAKTHYQVADWLKTLAEDWGRAVVLAGVPQTRQLLQTNEQLLSRFRHQVELKRLIELDDNLKALRSSLKSFQQRLEGIDAIDFSLPANAVLFGFATDGRFRELRNLLVAAVGVVARSELPTLNHKVLEQAFAKVIYPGAAADANPFAPKFRGTPLVKAGEPFAPVDHSWRAGRRSS
jgi:Bacterial TniB protein